VGITWRTLEPLVRDDGDSQDLDERLGLPEDMAHHVADRDPDRPIGQGKQVIPVAADLRLLSADQVAGRACDAGQRR
jgi:hypothetical protein